MGRRPIAVLLVAMALHATVASASDAGGQSLTFNGFGTLGVVHSSTQEADFIGSFFQPDGAGATHAWSAGVDSKLGLQVDAALGERLTATVQVAAQHQHDGHYDPRIEWANLKYQFTPDFSVRAGRTVTSSFLVSDSGLVSFTHPWVRPPMEVYGTVPLTHKDGIDVLYRLHVAAVTSSIGASYGHFSSKLVGGGDNESKRFFDVSETLEYGPVTLRIAYGSLRFDIHTRDIDQLFAGFRQFANVAAATPGLEATSAQALALVQRYEMVDVPHSVVTLGASYDPGNWLLMAEWLTLESKALIPDATAWYLTGGYRFGTVTPYATFARLDMNRRTEPGISAGGLPPQLAAVAEGLNAGLTTTIDAFTQAQQTVSAGVRWDLMRNAALKIQVDRLSTRADSTGLLGNIQPDFRRGSDLTLFSATVDFVF